MANESEEKAVITNKTTGQQVECMFRPKEYEFVKENQWDPAKAVGRNMQPPKFKGGQPMNLELNLLFDTYEAKKDVRSLTKPLYDMMKVTDRRKDPRTKRSEPPHVEFRWGKFWSFEGVIKSISQKFTLFLKDGTPARSTVKLTLMQAKEVDVFTPQNPTSGAWASDKVHTVNEGETIDWIAFVEYGTSNAWRHLADANNLDDPDQLRPGQRLLITPLND